MKIELYERVRAKRDIYYKNISEPVIHKGEEGFWAGEAAVFDKHRFADKDSSPPNHEYTLWAEGCVETLLEDDVESLGEIDHKVRLEEESLKDALFISWRNVAKCPCPLCSARRKTFTCS